MLGFSAEEKAKKYDRQARSYLELLGTSNCTPDGIMSVAHNLKARVFKLRSTDLSFLDDEDLVKWLDSFTNLNRVYTDDYKYLTLSSRIDTSSNQQYWHSLRNNLGHSKQEALRARIISENLNRVVNVEQQTDKYSELNFYIMIFGKTTRDIRNKTHLIEAADNGVLGLRSLDKKETQDLEFNLHNPNWR
ncbi:hypothetical protein [Lactobacillus johnsonii]|jgi:hypothetical protein|uniref:Uncharacterized protein n=1 Tax=Lactobacillus johnsonii TaxID=33959 RepID=A0A9X7TB99_LACJH|nr:hypothetical protein [Lactobacillus johnsonii]QIA88633.1 hypothetical protein FEE39_10345 [Lactobacillus johnsonii]